MKLRNSANIHVRYTDLASDLNIGEELRRYIGLVQGLKVKEPGPKLTKLVPSMHVLEAQIEDENVFQNYMRTSYGITETELWRSPVSHPNPYELLTIACTI